MQYSTAIKNVDCEVWKTYILPLTPCITMDELLNVFELLRHL